MRLTIHFLLIWALALALCASARPRSREWLDKNWASLDAAPELSLEENFAALQGVLRGIGEMPVEGRTPEESELFARVQDLFINTPGHAHFYRDRILEAKKEAFTNGQPARFPEYHDYTLERMYALQTLAHLPSLETMDVLNGFLDDKDRPGGEPGDLGYYNPLALTVSPTFGKLIEENAKKDYGLTWRQWRDAVRAGELTFRFKGSDVRYNFDGPVPAQPKRAEKGSPRSSPQDSPTTQPATTVATAENHSLRSSWPLWLAGSCVLGSLLYLALSRRQKIRS